MERNDVVVIGSGHNGLVAACYLAKAGLDVTVLEANDWIGGCTSTSALIPEAPEHRIGPCAQDFCLIRLSTIVADLGLKAYGYREVEVDPAYVIPGEDGETLAFWRDPVRTADEIRRYSRRDARAYLDFCEMLEAGMEAGLSYVVGDPTRPTPETLRAALRSVRHPVHLANLARMCAGSAADAIDARFTHPLLRGGLLSLAAVGAPVTHRGSGVNAMFPAIVRHAGVARPIGGAQMLPDALRACLEAHGGRVRTGAEAVGILTAGGRASGVRLASGEEVPARAVLSAMDPARTLRDLVPAGSLSDRLAQRVAAIPSTNGGTAYFTVHLAFAGEISFDRLQSRRRDEAVDLRRTALLAGSFEDMCAAVTASENGRLPARWPLAMIVPTGVDPSQAPPGQDTMYLWTGWAPRTPPEGWDALAPRAARALVDTASRYLDGIGELEIGRFVEPWTVLQERTRVPDGNPYYVDLLFSRNGPLRPALGLGGYTTPVDGLFLTGGGTHPGPSVSGLPGQIAARKMLARLPELRGRAPRVAAPPAGRPVPIGA